MSTLNASVTGDLARLANRANTSHHKAGEAIVSAIIHGIEAGQALVEAQGLVPYGQWGAWLAANFRGADRSARRWMRLYRERDRLPGGDPLRTGVSELTPSAALALLASKEEPEGAGREPLTASEGAQLHRHEATIGRGIKIGAESWRRVVRTLGAHPEGGKAVARVVAAVQKAPRLPVSRPDLRAALDSWDLQGLHRLLVANEGQPRLCGRILLAIERRGLHRPDFETMEAWREDAGWDGPEIDDAIAWARSNPDVPAEWPRSEADCCHQAWLMLSMPVTPQPSEPGTRERPTHAEKHAFRTSIDSCMLVGCAAGWPWQDCTELFVRAMEAVEGEAA